LKENLLTYTALKVENGRTVKIDAKNKFGPKNWSINKKKSRGYANETKNLP
jgi:hypothetical protein